MYPEDNYVRFNRIVAHNIYPILQKSTITTPKIHIRTHVVVKTRVFNALLRPGMSRVHDVEASEAFTIPIFIRWLGIYAKLRKVSGSYLLRLPP